MNLIADIESLYARAFDCWELVRENYTALSHMRLKRLVHNGREHVVQFNPCRYHSAVAGADTAPRREQECFLCTEHQPAEQESILWKNRYKIQINPYPIFYRHLTLSLIEHRPQCIVPYIDDMMGMAATLPGYVVFYNGPHSGASAPFHQHFQAVRFDELPLCREAIHDDCDLSVYYPFFYIIRKRKDEAKRWFQIIEAGMREAHETAGEPLQNVLCWKTEREWHIIIIPRAKHRPACYGNDREQYLISPASLEMCGVWPLVRESDFERITASRLQSINEEVAINENDKEYIMNYFLTHV